MCAPKFKVESKIYTVCNLTMCEMWGVWGTGEFTVNFTTFTYGEFHQKCEFMVKFTMCENHQRDFTFCKIQTKCEKYVNFTTCENHHEFRLFTHIGRLG